MHGAPSLLLVDRHIKKCANADRNTRSHLNTHIHRQKHIHTHTHTHSHTHARTFKHTHQDRKLNNPPNPPPHPPTTTILKPIVNLGSRWVTSPWPTLKKKSYSRLCCCPQPRRGLTDTGLPPNVRCTTRSPMNLLANSLSTPSRSALERPQVTLYRHRQEV